MKQIKTTIGFTLLELLIALAVASILAAMAAPSFKSSINKNTVESLQRGYLRGLNYARGEAVARNKLISICPSVDGNQCDTSNYDWSGGWLVFIDDGNGGYGNGVLNNDEELLRVYENNGSVTVSLVDPEQSGGSNNVESLSWNMRGFIERRAEFTFCSRDNDDRYVRGVSLERSGRTSLSQDQNDDGVHDSVLGLDTNLRCV